MKIGILTHPLGTNYGGILQNYALQSILKKLGHNPITLDYYSPIPLRVKILSIGKRLLNNILGKKMPLRGWPNGKETTIIAQNTLKFVLKYINTTDKIKLSQLHKLDSRIFDCLIVGSDQVWRGDRGYTEQFFFSDFQDTNIPKIAYAASMGVDFWSFNKRDTFRCKKLVKNFKAVSVREDSAIQLCREHFNVQPQLVLDPTLLLERKDYESLVSNVNSSHKNSKTMMVYILDKTTKKQKIIKKVSVELNLKINEVRANKYFSEVGSKYLNECIQPPVEHWIKGYMDADFVITDSYHGTIFSIIFNKPFIAIINNERGSARFFSLLKTFGLESRLIDSNLDSSIIDVINTPLNFSSVNSILSEKRNESILFLMKNLK